LKAPTPQALLFWLLLSAETFAGVPWGDTKTMKFPGKPLSVSTTVTLDDSKVDLVVLCLL